jgi:hypothetical protein
MASEPDKALYKKRSMAECPNVWRAAWGSAGCSWAENARPMPCRCGSPSHNMLRAFALRRPATIDAG